MLFTNALKSKRNPGRAPEHVKHDRKQQKTHIFDISFSTTDYLNRS